MTEPKVNDYKGLKDRLEEVLAECERLRKENAQLKFRLGLIPEPNNSTEIIKDSVEEVWDPNINALVTKHSISEIKVVLEDGLTIGCRPLRDFYETVGHGAAYNFMFSLIGERHISVEDIKTMHRLFYKNIDETNAGVWRKESYCLRVRICVSRTAGDRCADAGFRGMDQG